MEGLEQAGVGGLNPNLGAESRRVPIGDPSVQIALMLYAYREVHSLTDIDPANLELVDQYPEAVSEWVAETGDKKSMSELFRDYIDTKPDWSVNLHDKSELAEIFSALTTRVVH